MGLIQCQRDRLRQSIFPSFSGSIQEDDFQSPEFMEITETIDRSEAIVDYGWSSGLAG